MDTGNSGLSSCATDFESKKNSATKPSFSTEVTLASSSVIFLPLFSNSQMTSVTETTLSAITTALSMRQRDALISESHKDALIARSPLSSLIAESHRDDLIAQTIHCSSKDDSPLVDEQCTVKETNITCQEIRGQTIADKLSETCSLVETTVNNLSENSPMDSFIGHEIAPDEKCPLDIEESFTPSDESKPQSQDDALCAKDDMDEKYNLKPNIRDALLSKLSRSSSTTDESVLTLGETHLSIEESDKDLTSVGDKSTVEMPDCDKPEETSSVSPGSPESIISLSFSDVYGDSLDMEVDEVADDEQQCSTEETSDVESGQSGDVDTKSDDREDINTNMPDVSEYSSLTSEVEKTFEDMLVDQPESSNEDISALIESSVLSGQCPRDNLITPNERNKHENNGKTKRFNKEHISVEENMNLNDVSDFVTVSDKTRHKSEDDTDTGDEGDSPKLKLPKYNPVARPTPVFLFANKNHNRNLIQSRITSPQKANSSKISDVKSSDNAKLNTKTASIPKNVNSTQKNEPYAVIVRSSPNTVTQTSLSSSSCSQKPQLIGNAMYPNTATSLLKTVIDHVKHTPTSKSVIPAMSAVCKQPTLSTVTIPTVTQSSSNLITCHPSTVVRPPHPGSVSTPLVVRTSSNLSPTKKLIITDGKKVVVTTGYPFKTVHPMTVTSIKTNYPPFSSKHQKPINILRQNKSNVFDTTVSNIITNYQKNEKVNELSIKNIKYVNDKMSSTSHALISSTTIPKVAVSNSISTLTKASPSTLLKPIASLLTNTQKDYIMGSRYRNCHVSLSDTGQVVVTPIQTQKDDPKPLNNHLKHTVSITNGKAIVVPTSSSVQSSNSNKPRQPVQIYVPAKTSTAMIGNGTTQKIPTTTIASKPDLIQTMSSDVRKLINQQICTLNLPVQTHSAAVYSMSGMNSDTTKPLYTLPPSTLSVKMATTAQCSTGNQHIQSMRIVETSVEKNQMQRQGNCSTNLAPRIVNILGSAPSNTSVSSSPVPKKLIKLPSNYTVPNYSVSNVPNMAQTIEPLGKLISILPSMPTDNQQTNSSYLKQTLQSVKGAISLGNAPVKHVTNGANQTNQPPYYLVKPFSSAPISSPYLSTPQNTTAPVQLSIVNSVGSIETTTGSFINKITGINSSKNNIPRSSILGKNQLLVKALSTPAQTDTEKEHNYHSSPQIIHVYPPSYAQNPLNNVNTCMPNTDKTKTVGLAGAANTVLSSTQCKTMSVSNSSHLIPKIVPNVVTIPASSTKNVSSNSPANAKTASEILMEISEMSKSNSMPPTLGQKDVETKTGDLDIVIDSVFSLAFQHDTAADQSNTNTDKESEETQYFSYRFDMSVYRSGARKLDESAKEDSCLRRPCFVVLENLKEKCSRTECTVACRTNVVRKLCQRILEKSVKRRKGRRRRIYTSRKRQQKKRVQERNEDRSPIRVATPPVFERTVTTTEQMENNVTNSFVSSNAGTALPIVNTNDNQIMSDGKGARAITDGKGNKFLMIKIDNKTILIPALNNSAQPKAYVLEGSSGASLTEVINKLAKQQVTPNLDKINNSGLSSTNTSLSVARHSSTPLFSVAKTSSTSTSVTKTKTEPVTTGYTGDKDYTVTVKSEPESIDFEEKSNDQSDTIGPTPSKVPKTNSLPTAESAADRIKHLRNELKEREKALESLRRKRAKEDDSTI